MFIYTFVSGVLKLPSQGWGFQKQRSGSETSVSRTEEYPWWTRNGDISIFNKCLCLHIFVSAYITVVMLLNASYALTGINGMQEPLSASHDLHSWKTYHLCVRQPWKQTLVELTKTDRPRTVYTAMKPAEKQTEGEYQNAPMMLAMQQLCLAYSVWRVHTFHNECVCFRVEPKASPCSLSRITMNN